MNPKNTISFISHKEHEKFENYYLSRSFTLENSASSEDELHKFFSREISAVVKKGDYHTPKCYFIEADDTDGMSWSLEKLKNSLSDSHGHFYCTGLIDTKRNEDLPRIAQLISEKVLIKLAVRNNLMPRFQNKSPLRVFFLSLISIFIATVFIVLKKILENLAPHDFSEVIKLLYDPYFITVFIVAVLVGFVLQKKSSASKKSKEEAVIELNNNLRDEDSIHSKKYKNLLHKVSQCLLVNYPCFVFVDKYETLDLFSQKVIETYFNSDFFSPGLAVWVIFQTSIKNSEKLYIQVDQLAQSPIFKLKLLKYKEKEELIKALDLPHYYADYTTIKEICHGKANEKNINTLIAKLREYNMANPVKPDTATETDLLYILSLNTKPYNLFYSYEYYIEVFKSGEERDNIRNIILKDILKNIPLTKAKLEPRFIKIFNELNYSIVRDNGTFKVADGLNEAFKHVFAELNLPDPKLGHLYWSLFHGDRLQKHASQFLWTRILTYQLRNTDYNAYEKYENSEDYKKIILNLYNYHIKAINLSIKTCYTQEIIELLKISKSLLSHESLYSNVTILNNFLKKAWQVYSLLYDNQVLEIIFSIVNDCQIPSHEVENILDTVFFETLSEPDIQRSENRLNLFCIHPVEYKNSKAISNYFRTLSAWFSISLIPLMKNRFEELSLYSAALFSFDHLNYQNRALERIITNEEDEFKEIDFRTLSLSIWASALKLKCHANQGLIFPNMIKNTENIDLNRVLQFIGKPLNQEFDELLKFIESVLSEIKKYNLNIIEKGESSKEATYYSKGLIFELVTISLASVIMSLKYLHANPSDTSLLEKINTIFSMSNELVNVDLPPIRNTSEIHGSSYVMKIDDLFEFSSIIWERLGLTSINNQIAIRRLQFLLECNQNESELLNKLEDLRLPLNEHNFLGLLCNVILAAGLNQIELKSFYFNRAIQVLFDNNSGIVIKREFSLMLVIYLYHVKANIDRYFLEILSEKDFFTGFLNTLSDDLYYQWLIHLTHSLEKVENIEIKDHVIELLKQRKDQTRDDSIKHEVENWFDSIELEKKIRSGGNLEIDQVLEQWKNRKDSWLYPLILETCIRNGYFNDEIKNSSLEAIRTGLLFPDKGNTYLYLAHQLSFINLDSRELNLSLTCLEEHIKFWEDKLAIDYSIQIYERLEACKYGNSVFIKAKLEELKKEKWINDHLQLLPSLINKGAYYILFKEYFKSLLRYGLPVDIDYQELYTRLNVKPDEKVQFVAKWKRGGSELPALFLRDGNFTYINSDFIMLGDFLLSHQLLNDPAYDVDRRELNSHVCKHISELFEVIKSLKVPDYFIHTLDSFIEKHLYTIPE